MGIMPHPGAGAGIDLAGQRLPNRWELELTPAAAQVLQPEPEREPPDPSAAIGGAASPELHAFLNTKGGSSPPAQRSPAPRSSASPAPGVSFHPSAVAQAKASLGIVPEPGQRDLVIAVTAEAGIANRTLGGKGKIAHGRRRGSPTRHYSKKPGGGGSYGVVTGPSTSQAVCNGRRCRSRQADVRLATRPDQGTTGTGVRRVARVGEDLLGLRRPALIDSVDPKR